MDPKSLFPMSYSKPQCDEWFDRMKAIFPDDKSAPWMKFYDEAADPINSKVSRAALEKGEDLKAAIIAHPASKDSRWRAYQSVSGGIRSAMESCPHVQWFRPDEYKDNISKAPLPNLLALMKWVRTQHAGSQVEAALGNSVQARESLKPIYEASEKMLIEGQPLINMLIGMAVQKIWLVGQAGVLAMSDAPLDPDDRRMVETSAMQGMEWFTSSISVELFSLAGITRKPADPAEAGYSPQLPGFPFVQQMFQRAMMYGFEETELSAMTQWVASVRQAFNPRSNVFGWQRYNTVKIRASIATPNLRSTYGRALSLLTQARLVLMMDEVLKYRRDHKTLPENLDFVQASWRTDPFTEKPLIYKKEAANKFVVYSLGPDMHDDGAQNLYVSGPMTFQTDKKEDIGFRIFLH